MRCRVAVVFAISIYYSVACSAAVSKKITLKKAMALKTISVMIKANGGIGDQSLHLDLANNTDTDYTVVIDPALIFVPTDTNYQNQVIQGDETITIAACSQKGIDMAAYCGKSYAHCPFKDLKYGYWKQGDTNMIKIMRYGKESNAGRALVQRAVWMFTNGHCLSTVYDDNDPVATEKFVSYIAGVRKCAIPAFHMSYKFNNRPGRSFMDPNAKIYLTFHWGHEGYRQMYLDIFKENGDLYKRIEASRIIDKDGNTVQLEFDPLRDPKGTYTVKLHDNSNKIWDEKKVTVGLDPCDIPARVL